MADLVGNKISTNGTYTLAVAPGRYALGIGGTSFGGAGSLAVKWVDAAGNAIAYPDSPLTAVGGFEIVVPGSSVSLILTGATSPDILVSLTRLD